LRVSAPQPVPSSAGLLLPDARLNPVFVNRAAAQILSYPQGVESINDIDQFLSRKIRSTFVSKGSPLQLALPGEFRSGRRVYVCRSFQCDSVTKGSGRDMIAVLFERSPTSGAALRQISERFHLTNREQQVLELLLGGLTSKEIAARMEISPNTVKAFLRLIMIKTGVSTRSGIVSKALTARP
jgi:DNA-binding CsgD family transcriptional regulator